MPSHSNAPKRDRGTRDRTEYPAHLTGDVRVIPQYALSPGSPEDDSSLLAWQASVSSRAEK